MNRLRLAAPALILGLGLLSGCCNVGQGQILSRLGFGRRCPCETCGSNPTCCEGPDLGDGGWAGGMNGGGPVIMPSDVPGLAPPPQRLPPQAVPVPAPADQVSISKTR
jgi:hypothetical protein